MKVAAPLSGAAHPDPCLDPNFDLVDLFSLVRLWKPTDLAFLHVMKQFNFEPEIWDKCKDSQLVAQLSNRAPRRTVLIKIFSQN